MAFQGLVFAGAIVSHYLDGQFSEMTALAATLAWSIYLSAKAWEYAQIRGCERVLWDLNSCLIRGNQQVSVSFEQAAKLPPGMFDFSEAIVLTDKVAPSENKSSFSLGASRMQEPTGIR